MRAGTRRALLAVCLCVAACVTRPRDPFGAAERAMQEHDLARALQALDTVPVGHAYYPEARAAALDVERTMRRCHELVLEAMLLRAEWRDRDALVLLQRVHDLWPTLTSVDVLIAATEQRLLLLGEQPRKAPKVAPAAPMIEVAPRAPVSPPARHAAEPAAPPAGDDAAVVHRSDDPVAVGLVAVEARLGRGQMEGAVRDLDALALRFPRDARVRLRLARLLHQRALLRYGEGALAAAVADWRRVLEIDPAHAAAKRLLESAEGEQRAVRH